MDYPMTVRGKKLLEEELDQLVKVDREKIKIDIAEARALGDLKENAEYHAAKEKQSHIEGRIMEIQGRLSKCKLVDPSQSSFDHIVFGATVTVFDHQKDESLTFQIVGDNEARITENTISYLSPLGKALLGKEEGDEVVVKAPKGDLTYEVESVEYK